MTSSNGNIFRAAGHLCGEFTGHRWIPSQRPVTRSFDVFFNLCLNRRLSKQSGGLWFETPPRSLWCHCYVLALYEVEPPVVPPHNAGPVMRGFDFSLLLILTNRWTNDCVAGDLGHRGDHVTSCRYFEIIFFNEIICVFFPIQLLFIQNWFMLDKPLPRSIKTQLSDAIMRLSDAIMPHQGSVSSDGLMPSVSRFWQHFHVNW